VFDHDGTISRLTVLRDGVKYTAVSVLVNLGYYAKPSPRLDAAVLVMDQPIPGPSATVGDVLPAVGLVTLVGFQPLDTDGKLLRGTRYNNRPQPKGTTGGVVVIKKAPAGCVQPVSNLKITDTKVIVPCGLIQGASGGGLFVERNGEHILVGITSTVSPDLTYNSVTPLAALHDLLNHPAAYTHTVPLAASTQSHPIVVQPLHSIAWRGPR
jgi:hypothetical protein